MAETLISPGVAARENDQSFVTSQPVERGAAIVGPTVLGPVEKPTLISSFSSYQAIFGGALQSGSNEYTYLTSIAANQYFQNGGTSLLVTRVTSGSFSPATSTTVQSNKLALAGGLFGNIISDLDPTNNGSAPVSSFSSLGTYSNLLLDGTTGTGASGSITVSSAAGLLVVNSTLTPEGAAPTTTNNATATNISTFAGTSVTSGTGAVISVTSTGLVISSIEITSVGSGYKVGDSLVVEASVLSAADTAALGTVEDDLTIVIGSANLLGQITSLVITSDGEGYVVGDTITIPNADIGSSGADPIFIITAASLERENAFTLETLTEGEIMNNVFPFGSDTDGRELPNGALTSGSTNNLRWEILSSNTASGVFSLGIRRGNDNNNSKSILETYNNISLDPFSPNYISRAIGDISTNLVTEGADTFLQESGSFPQISSYVRVKSVNLPTPNYFNNDGSAKSVYTSSIPQMVSGSFNGANGKNIPTGRAANFYQYINNTDAQGLVGSDYNNAIALLASQDDYQYNVMSVPGLTNQDHAAQITSVINNAISRGDNIAVIDLVRYNSQINAVTTQAGGIDNSYTATYWPWLQTIDPNSGQLVYIPASTFLPGVYAFTDASSDPWFAPAGITRGGMGQVVRAERKLTSTNRDTLYEANVNPIATFPQQGVVVFGQKTLQKAASALDRVNVRRLLITLKSFISQIADNLVFEQNTIATRQNFLTQVNPYLESVQQRQGLYAFKVVMDESNNTPDVIDRNELIGQIFLQPTRTAEFIMLDFNVLPTGATFPA
jgi:phage tail sheath protein FI